MKSSTVRCPQLVAADVKKAWQQALKELKNGKPIDKAFPWENVLTEDAVTVNSALSVLTTLQKDVIENMDDILEKLASCIPSSHSKGILIKYYLSCIRVLEKDTTHLLNLVNHYPPGMYRVNIFLEMHFNLYSNDRKKMISFVAWCSSYFDAIIERCDSNSIIHIDWMSKFRYQPVHDYLLSAATRLEPVPAKTEYWIVMYKILSTVVPASLPAFVSINKFTSVTFSVAASVSPACPYSALQIIEVASPSFHYLSLTPCIVALLATTMLRFPTINFVPLINKLLEKVDTGKIRNLLGILLFPLAYISVLDYSTDFRNSLIELSKQILNLKEASTMEKNILFHDDYASACIKTPQTINALKMGQILSHVGEHGSTLIEKRLQKSVLSLSTASIFCHCLVMSKDRPTPNLLSVFDKADDTTNLGLLAFLISNINFINNDELLHSNEKFYTLYVQSIHRVTRHASPRVLRHAMQWISEVIKSHPRARVSLYTGIWLIWQRHGGIVLNEFSSLLSHIPHGKDVELAVHIVSILKKMCEGERPLDYDAMQRLILQYRRQYSNDRRIQLSSLAALVHLCDHGMDFLRIKELVDSSLNEGEPYREFVALYYSKHFVEIEDKDLQLEAFLHLKSISDSHVMKTADVAFMGLSSFLDYDAELVVPYFQKDFVRNFLDRSEYPPAGQVFLSKLVEHDLRTNPVRPIGTTPNPSKDLIEKFKLRSIGTSRNLLQMLFSYPAKVKEPPASFTAIILTPHTTVLKSYLDGILMIEGWCHMMYEYTRLYLTNPRSQGNSANQNLNSKIENVLTKVKSAIAQNSVKSEENFINIIFITSFTRTIYRIFVEENLPAITVKKKCSGYIGILDTMLKNIKQHDENKAICLLCIAHVIDIARRINDEELVSILFKSVTSVFEECQVEREAVPDLVWDCAGLAVGVAIENVFQCREISSELRRALQALISNQHYLGMSSCVNVWTIVVGSRVSYKFIDDFSKVISEGNPEEMNHMLFIASLYVTIGFTSTRNLSAEIEDFIGVLIEKVNTAATLESIEYYLIIVGRLFYQLNQTSTSYSHLVEEYTKHLSAKFSENYGAKGALALLTGFPMSSFISYLDWGCDISLAMNFKACVQSSQPKQIYEEGRTMFLIIGRQLARQSKKQITYKVNNDTLWGILSKELTVLQGVYQKPESKKVVQLILEVCCSISCSLPLSHPVESLVSIYHNYSLETLVIRCAGHHSQNTDEFFRVIEPLLSLSVASQVPLETQLEIVTQIPNYVNHIEKSEYPYFFTVFLRQLFWKDGGDLRQRVLTVILQLIKSNDDIKQLFHYSLDGFFFSNPSYHLLTEGCVDTLSEIMITLEYFQLPLKHLKLECRFVSNFITRQIIKEDNLGLVLSFTEHLLKEVTNSAELMRCVMDVILLMPETMAFNVIHHAMTISTKAITDDPENLSAAICCVGLRVAAYLGFLSATASPLTQGLEFLYFTDDFLEHKVIVDCLAVVLKHIDNWHVINKIFNKAIPD